MVVVVAVLLLLLLRWRHVVVVLLLPMVVYSRTPDGRRGSYSLNCCVGRDWGRGGQPAGGANARNAFLDRSALDRVVFVVGFVPFTSSSILYIGTWTSLPLGLYERRDETCPPFAKRYRSLLPSPVGLPTTHRLSSLSREAEEATHTHSPRCIRPGIRFRGTEAIPFLPGDQAIGLDLFLGGEAPAPHRASRT